MSQDINLSGDKKDLTLLKKWYWSILITLLAIIPSFINIFRRLDSGDYEHYYTEYMNIGDLLGETNPDTAYRLIFYLIYKLFFGSWECFAFITTFVAYFFTLQAIRKYGEHIGCNKTTIFFGFSIILFNPQFFLFSGHLVKMWMAYSFCLCSLVYYIINKKQDYVNICLALFCHAGSIFIALAPLTFELSAKSQKKRIYSFFVILGLYLLGRVLLSSSYAGTLTSRLSNISNNEYTDYYTETPTQFLFLLGISILISAYLFFQKDQIDKDICYCSFFILFVVLALRSNYLVLIRVLDFLYFIFPVLAMTLLKNGFRFLKMILIGCLIFYFISKIESFSYYW